MRTKDEILADCRHDIKNETFKEEADLWLEHRKIEVLIDIRDEIHKAAKDIQEAIWNMPGKD
jgi:hypothetical protein